MKRTRCLIIILLQFSSIAAMTQSYALNQITNDLTIKCSQSSNKQILSCDYSNRTAAPILSISAKYAETNLPINEGKNYPNLNAITAVLFLIDTSDPARQNVIDKNIEHIRELLSLSGNHYQFGLASFNKKLYLEVPIGSKTSIINETSKKLKATGSTTELYRSMLEAIALFKDIHATKKSIFLFSDGLAEDKAYFHNDVVSAARKADIIISSIGYPRTISQSVSLQTLRRLSEETGGVFVESDHKFDISKELFHQTFNSLDNGGTFIIPLHKIINKKIENEKNIVLDVETDIGTNTVSVPIKFNSSPITQKIPAIMVESQPVINKKARKPSQLSPPIQIVSQPRTTHILETWLWYGIPIGLFILMILTIAIFFLFLRRQNKNQINPITYPEIKPYAYLIKQDETKASYPIIKTTCRLGRSKNNEIPLRDTSVSRRHAEIHRDQGDEFTLIDLNSLNGVFINNEKIGRYKLKEGDIIEIGDINLRFSLIPTDHQIDESTIMQNTRIPRSI